MITLIRVKIHYIERISIVEWAVNCTVIYQRAKYKISKEDTLQLRVPELRDTVIKEAICTTLENSEAILDFIREFNEAN